MARARPPAASAGPAAGVVSSSGDIAPAVGGLSGGMPLAVTPTGAFAGLIALAVVAAMFVGAEYQRGLIAVTLAASPRARA